MNAVVGTVLGGLLALSMVSFITLLHTSTKRWQHIATGICVLVQVATLAWWVCHVDDEPAPATQRIDWQRVPDVGPYKPPASPITQVQQRQRHAMYAALAFERVRP